MCSRIELLCRLDRVSPYRGGDDGLWTVQVVIASLELGFELHFEVRKVDKVPARKIPAAVFFARLVLKSDDEMDGVITHLVRRDFWFEIKRAQAAVATSDSVKFWIEIKNTLACEIDQAQIGIARALHTPFGRSRKIATKSRR